MPAYKLVLYVRFQLARVLCPLDASDGIGTALV